MNFVGHAVVAGWERSDPAFAFGAMVPDLRRFAGGEPLDATSRPATVSAGIDSHHRVDAAFHASPQFRAWTASVLERMPQPDRGARAAAHVAVELAIDGALLAGGATAYDEALRWAASSVSGPWEDVVAHLRRGAVVDAYRTPAGIAARVVSVMGRRPRLRRLAVDAGDLAVAIAAIAPTIDAAAAALVEELATPTAP